MRAPTGRARGVLSYFTRHRTAANLLLVLMLAAGLWALPQMRAQFFPDTASDDIDISVAWPGAGAEDVDRAVIQLLEPALTAVDGVSATSAVAREGRASITLEFEPGTDIARAEADVQEALDGVGNLPEGAEEPEIRGGRWSDRVTDVVITGPVAPEQLGRFADEFVARLFRAGVSRATIQGIVAPETVIEVTSASLIRHDLTLSEIAETVGREVSADPAGDVAGGTARVRTGAERRDADAIRAIVLRSGTDGEALTVGDVADVLPAREAGLSYYVGENPAVSLRVERSASGDAIGIQADVERVAAEMEPLLPEGTRIDLVNTLAEAITGRIAILVDNAITGLILVVGLLFLFLNARTAFWVAAGIPVALLAALALMWAAGLTINMISLFALIITLGIVVDDAIVVGEHADWRHRTLGESPARAAETAAIRMAAPVFSATLTTIIAFFSLVVLGGRFGDLVSDIPFTVIAVLAASLVECFLILPNHMSHALGAEGRGRATNAAIAVLAALVIGAAAAVLGFGDPWAVTAANARVAAIGAAVPAGAFLLLPRRWKAGALAAMRSDWYDLPSRGVNRVFDLIRDRAFRPLIRLAITARYAVIAGALAVLASQVALFLDGTVPWRFFNSPEQGSVTGNFAMLPGATREDAVDMMRELQRAAEAVADRFEAEHGRDPVTYALAQIGGGSGRGLGGERDADLLGAISIELIDADLRPYSSFAFVAALQEEVRKHPLLEEVSFRGWRSGPGGDPISVRLLGAEAAVLKEAAESLKADLARLPGVSGLTDTLAYDKEELVLDLTPQGRALGFDIGALGRTLSDRLGGIEAASYPLGSRSATVRIELPERERAADFLDRTLLRTAGGDYVPLTDIVTVESRRGFETIRREDGARVVTVSGDVSEDDPGAAVAVTEALETELLPRLETRFGIGTELSGLAEQERAFLNDALIGFLLCLLGIYLVLAWIFASWTRPAVIMSVIPFGLIGTIHGHAAWEVPLSMFTVVGLIGMTGIIINDSIVLITTIDERAGTRGLVPAIVDGTADRLRPVLLTTLTTVLGLAPLLFEQSMQAQFLKPTVITLCYGLGFGVVVVLLVVPALLAVQRDVGRSVASARRVMLRRGGGPARAATLGFAAAAMLLFAATLAPAAVTGAVPEPLAALVPGDGLGGAFAAFVAGTVVLAATAWVLGAIWIAMLRKRPAA